MGDGQQIAGGRDDEAGASDVAQRVRSLIEAAERTASAIKNEAEREASALLENAKRDAESLLTEARRSSDAFAAERRARISELSDDLVQRAEALASNLVKEMADVAEQIAQEAAVEGSSGSAEPRARLAVAQPSESASPNLPERENAQLVALQMAVAGSSRADVEVHVEKTFDLPDHKTLVEEVFQAFESVGGAATPIVASGER